MPVFWALAEGEESTGATIHQVDEGIDTGQIIERRAVLISPADTEHSLYARICRHGAELILNVIADARDGSIAASSPAQDERSSYNSVPTRNAVRQFRGLGRRFFTIAELLKPFERL